MVLSKLNHLPERNSFSPSKTRASTSCTAAAATRAAPLVASKFSKVSPVKWASSNETASPMEAELGPNVRLSCQIRVNSDLKVLVINQASVRGMDPGPRPFDE